VNNFWYHHNPLGVMMGNENLHHLILMIKSWLDDTHVDYDGA
jgi:hypothetical protein